MTKQERQRRRVHAERLAKGREAHKAVFKRWAHKKHETRLGKGASWSNAMAAALGRPFIG